MKGLFVGLTTLDCLYLAKRLPQSNEKVVALEQLMTVGGPATNAAIAFSQGEYHTLLVSVIGHHFLSSIVRQELETYGIQYLDLAPERLASPPISSIIVTQATGERAVISLNATQCQISPEVLTEDILDGVDIVLIDGHQLEISVAITVWAKEKNIPVVLDGGSWKPGLESVLPYVNYAICSAKFFPPNCQNLDQVIAYLKRYEIPHIAITQGEKPIQYITPTQRGETSVKPVKVVDTLGAGDIFHGTFCHAILQTNFTEALAIASEIAGLSCQYFGPRQWLINRQLKH